MRKRILVTDASETVLDVCRGALTGRGYTALCHNDGSSALREATQGDCDLAVIATETAGMAGYELVGKLRQTDETKRMPILMLIGSSELLEPDELLDAGPDATLTKPFAPQELLHKVDSLLLRATTKAAKESSDSEVDLASLLETEAQFVKRPGEDNELREFLNTISEEEEEQPQGIDGGLVDRVELLDGEGEPQLRQHDDAPEVDDSVAAESQAVGPEHEASIGLDEFDRDSGGEIYLEPSETAEQSEAEAIYLDQDAGADAPTYDPTGSSEVEKLKSEFVRELAQALAREIADRIDFEKILARLDENLAGKERF